MLLVASVLGLTLVLAVILALVLVIALTMALRHHAPVENIAGRGEKGRRRGYTLFFAIFGIQ